MDDMNDFEAAIEEIGETALNHNATVILTDHCIGCGNGEDFAFYNWEREEYNTVLLDFDSNLAPHLHLTMPNVLILVCNFCRAKGIEEENIKRNLVRMIMEGALTKFQ